MEFNYMEYIKTLYSPNISDELLDSMIFQAKLTISYYSVSEYIDGKINNIYKTLVGLYVGCQLQKLGLVLGGGGIITGLTTEDFSTSFGGLSDKEKEGIPSGGNMCDLFKFFATQIAKKNGLLKGFITAKNRRFCR